MSALLSSKALGKCHKLLLQLCQTPPGVPQELTAFKYSPPSCRNQNHLSPRSSHGVTFLAGLQMFCFISTSSLFQCDCSPVQQKQRPPPPAVCSHSSSTGDEAGGSRHGLAGGQGCILGTSKWCRAHLVPAPGQSSPALWILSGVGLARSRDKVGSAPCPGV